MKTKRQSNITIVGINKMKNKILALIGSGEFTSSMNEVDKYLLSQAKTNLKLNAKSKVRVAIIPTAAGKEIKFKKWIDDGIDHFSKLGAEPVGLPVINKRDTENKKMIEIVQKAHFIYFSGGDPGYLFYCLNKSPLWKIIESLYKRGAVLAGSSAGAMVMGSFVLGNVYNVIEKNDYPVWDKAFGLVPYPILPHFDYIIREEKEHLDRIIVQSPLKIKRKILGIDENTGFIVFDDNQATVMGKGHVHILQNEKDKVYIQGEIINIV